MSPSLKHGWMILPLALLMILPVGAQNERGTILGHVEDQRAGILVNARVTVRNVNTGIKSESVTTSSGDYVFVNLIPGIYDITVERKGLQTAVARGLTLQVDQTLRQNFTMQVGTLEQQVTVSADSQMVQADNATIGQVITAKQIQALPISGRDFTNLLATNAGVTEAAGGIQATLFDPHGLNTQFHSVSVDGARPASISYIIDGITDTDLFFSRPTNVPSADAIQEFKLQNGLYSAQYGFGSGQVNVAIKSGTNQFHGILYDFLENSAFQPKNPVNTYLKSVVPNFTGYPNPPRKQNQFGAQLGGPVLFPKLYNGRNRTFWFASYEGGRLREATAAQQFQVPSAQERQGNFSDWPFPIYDPATTGALPSSATNPTGRTPFPGNTIPANRISAQGLALLNLIYPAANINCGLPCANFASSASHPLDTNVITARIDHHLTDRDQLSFTANAGRYNETSLSPLPLLSTDVVIHSYLFGLQYQRNFTSHLVGQFNAGYNRENYNNGAPASYDSTVRSALGFLNEPNPPGFFGIPIVTIASSYNAAVQGNNANHETDNIYQLSGTLSWVRGSHTVNAGGDVRQVRLQDFSGFGKFGTLNFNGAYTSADPTKAGGAASAVNGNSAADVLLGDPRTVSAPGPFSAPINLRGAEMGFFFQDDWRITPRLTLNLGVRYEIPVSFHSLDNSGSVITLKDGGGVAWADKNFVDTYGTSNPTARATYFQCCVTNKLVSGRVNNFLPRIGFAWRPFASDRFVVRGGFGMYDDLYMRFYDDSNYASNLAYVYKRNPYYATTAASGGESVSPFALNTLFKPPVTIAPNSLDFTPGWQNGGFQSEWPLNKPPYIQQWSFDTQFAVSKDVLVDVGYVGSRSRNEPIQYFVNDATLPSTPNVLANGAVCNGLIDASQATGRFAGCAATGSAFQPIDTRIPYPNLGPSSLGTYANANVLYSTYHSLQVRVEQRLKFGLNLRANYTWSKALDTNSEIATFSNGSGGSNELQDTHNVRSDYGPADYDQPHRAVLSYVYDIPVGKGKRFSLGPANWIFGDWQTSGIVTLASGVPFSVFCCSRGQQTDLTGDPFGDRLRANLVPGQDPRGTPQTLTDWFNEAAFTPPPLGAFGNTGRNILRAPSYRRGDLSFLKNFPFSDRQNLQFRLDIFNVFSSWHSVQRVPVHGIASTNFGALIPRPGTSVTAPLGEENLWTPRILQLALRYTF
ncbi:MAG: carboxypeptidase regulatory-like domain-containing protein [Bryobacteraceae bacterium]